MMGAFRLAGAHEFSRSFLEIEKMAIKISELDDLRNFLDRQTLCHFSTLMKDGSPQSSPVGYLREDDQILVNVAEGTLKLRNVRRDPRVAISIHVYDPETAWPNYVLMRGKVVEIVEGKEANLASRRFQEHAMHIGEAPDANPIERKISEMWKAQFAAAAASGDNRAEAAVLGHEARFVFKIDMDRIQHFIVHGRGVLVSLTEDGERTSALQNLERHDLWKKQH